LSKTGSSSRLGCEQLSSRDTEGSCDTRNVPEGRIPFAALYAAEICPVNASLVRELFLRNALSASEHTNAITQERPRIPCHSPDTRACELMRKGLQPMSIIEFHVPAESAEA